jgi:hypothetical protein
MKAVYLPVATDAPPLAEISALARSYIYDIRTFTCTGVFDAAITLPCPTPLPRSALHPDRMARPYRAIKFFNCCSIGGVTCFRNGAFKITLERSRLHPEQAFDLLSQRVQAAARQLGRSVDSMHFT